MAFADYWRVNLKSNQIRLSVTLYFCTLSCIQLMEMVLFVCPCCSILRLCASKRMREWAGIINLFVGQRDLFCTLTNN